MGGKRGSHRSGEPVEVEIRARYYFGGPVAGARVEAIVQQRDYHPDWSPPLPHAWMEQSRRPSPGFQGGRTIGRHPLVTDAKGVARLRIDTTRFARSDSELTVEARVVDASRREIVGRGSLRVTRRPWFVFLHPERRVHRVGDIARVGIRAQDANEQPVAIEGQVTITRERWREIWLDPAGREVSGEPLAKLRAELASFPPPHRRGERPWRLHFQGYEPELVSKQELRTGENGAAELRFEVKEEGYYRIAWVSEPEGEVPVRARGLRVRGLGAYARSPLSGSRCRDSRRPGRRGGGASAPRTAPRHLAGPLRALQRGGGRTSTTCASSISTDTTG